MQFKYVLLAAAAAVAVSAETSQECIVNNKCDSDVACIAKCFNVPAPTYKQVNEATSCIEDCKGNAACYTDCINTYFMGNNGNTYTDGSANAPENTNASATTEAAATATATDAAASATATGALSNVVAGNSTVAANNTTTTTTSGAGRTVAASLSALVLSAAYLLL
ncbi:hypothetical protein BCR36DRAFT_582167 [Piromyces finnis]|uniref:Extracellular membrane protein CFEM domain-containing protein n=1 Tax=Piromyces finnis TaxID=1754191 RepID=A0A1Y1VD25_9FUNG|nr:hypothetical protein BCR36DRAFT_582167 [Piromyces finnis]|eukprot:ORX53310.1 hypothetical protein BCR36DRAFT_582167 [Piromyces finnis]